MRVHSGEEALCSNSRNTRILHKGVPEVSVYWLIPYAWPLLSPGLGSRNLNKLPSLLLQFSPETTDQRWHRNETERDRPCDTAVSPEARATSLAQRGSQDPTGAAQWGPAGKHTWEQTREENEGTRTGEKKIKCTFFKHLVHTKKYGTYIMYLAHFCPYKILGGMMWLYIM